jgi:hypothetical protein
MEPLLYSESLRVYGLKRLSFAGRSLTGVALRTYRATLVCVVVKNPREHEALNFCITIIETVFMGRENRKV